MEKDCNGTMVEATLEIYDESSVNTTIQQNRGKGVLMKTFGCMIIENLDITVIDKVINIQKIYRQSQKLK